MPLTLPSASANNASVASCVVKALVEATPISGPARVISTSRDSRTSEVSGTLHTTSRSDEHTSELQSLMRISYVVFFLKNITHIPYTNKSVTVFYLHFFILYNHTFFNTLI